MQFIQCLTYHFVLVAFCHICNALVPRKLGSFQISNPGFLELALNESETNVDQKWNLLVSRFNGFPFSRDYVSMVRGIGQYIEKPNTAKAQDITDQLHWPNEVAPIPLEVFNRPNMIVVPSGFLVPTKTNGALSTIDLNDDNPPVPITPTDESWFYHRAIWLHMDNDDRLDALTCRAKKPIIGKSGTQMVWFKQPDVEKPWLYSEWDMTILSETDCDTFLINATLSVGPTKEIINAVISAGFFSKTLDVWWKINKTREWNMNNIQKKVIDNTQGQAFDVRSVDINADGKEDLLVTYNEPKNGTLFVYEIPDDFRTNKSWTKHMLKDGITPAKSGMGKGSPGAVRAIHPDKKNPSGKPDLLMSGDDNGQMFLLTPNQPNNSSDWSYTTTVLLDSTPGTVGQFVVGDVNGDGYLEIFVPSYTDNKITVYTYAQESTNLKESLLYWIEKLLYKFETLF